MSRRLSERTSRLAPSPIRAILRAASGRAVISLAGGLPAPETFPDIQLEATGWQQYGITEGEAPLREEISSLLELKGIECPPHRILVLNGSQQGIDLAAKLTIDRGTPLLCEDPTYVAALQVFRLFGADIHGMPIGPAGPAPGGPESAMEGSGADVCYMIPSFHNPTGACWSEEARAEFAEAADRRHLLVIEDDPYSEIGFGEPVPKSLCGRLERTSWIHLGSFSKTFLPGLRMGYLAASEDVFAQLELLKQASDLHSNRLSQAMVLADLLDTRRPERLSRLRERYRTKRDAFDEALRRHFPAASWSPPSGGLFFWARLSDHMDLRTIAPLALENGVAFLPGEHCYCQKPELGWARLNFSHPSPEEADRALDILAKTLAC